MTGEQYYALYQKLRRDRGFYQMDWSLMNKIAREVWERFAEYQQK